MNPDMVHHLLAGHPFIAAGVIFAGGFLFRHIEPLIEEKVSSILIPRLIAAQKRGLQKAGASPAVIAEFEQHESKLLEVMVQDLQADAKNEIKPSPASAPEKTDKTS